jgi:hypothetical protein
MKIKPIERFFLIGWAVVIMFVFATFKGRIHPSGVIGKLLELLFSNLSAPYLQ